MPTTYTEQDDRREKYQEKTRRNLQNTIDTHLKQTTGTPAEVVQAIEDRAKFLEQEYGNTKAAEKVREQIPTKFENVINLYTLQEMLGNDYDFRPRLQEVISSIDTDFPELDKDDQLFLKQDILTIFSTPQQHRSCVNEDSLKSIVNSQFEPYPVQNPQDLSCTFAKANIKGDYRAVIQIDPGTTSSTAKLDDKDIPNAAILEQKIKSLYKDTYEAEGKYYDALDAQRDAAREAQRNLPDNKPPGS